MSTIAIILLKLSKQGELKGLNQVVITVTGHGLKDPDWALKDERGKKIKPRKVAAAAGSVADLLGLERNR